MNKFSATALVLIALTSVSSVAFTSNKAAAQTPKPTPPRPLPPKRIDTSPPVVYVPGPNNTPVPAGLKPTPPKPQPIVPKPNLGPTQPSGPSKRPPQ
jgi:hypothetical protein